MHAIIKRSPIITSIILLANLLYSHQVKAALTLSFENDIFQIEKGAPQNITVVEDYIIAALAYEGVVVLDRQGNILDQLRFDYPFSEATFVSASDVFQFKDENIVLIAIADRIKSRIILRGLNPNTGKFIQDLILSADGFFSVNPAPTHLCMARDIYDNSLYLFAGNALGNMKQYRIFTTASDEITIRLDRTIPVGGATTSCISDNASGVIYIVEPDMGVWSIDADVDLAPSRHLVAGVKPFGRLVKPVSVSIIEYENQRVPLISDVGSKSFLRLLPETGEITAEVSFPSSIVGISGSIENISVGYFSHPNDPSGVFAVAVEGNSGDGEIRLLPINKHLGKAPEQILVVSNPVDAVVYPLTMTAPISPSGDSANAPAIWIHPEDPALSLILGTDKRAGLGVYDLSGNLLQFLRDGQINNVDVRSGFMGIKGLEYIVSANERAKETIEIYAIDPETRLLSNVGARSIPAEFYDPYGLCMYRNRETDTLYVIAINSDGLLHQWRLFHDGRGKVDAELVRRLNIGTVAEGCVADDETGYLYIAEEDVAIWRYMADPNVGDDRTAIANVRPEGELIADIEGVTIYKKPDGEGYIIASSQGSSSYAVYDRKPPHKYRGMFRIRANVHANIDGTSQTDGIDVTSIPLPGYPAGLLVAQDGRYDETQNFKYISWQDIAENLRLQDQ